MGTRADFYIGSRKLEWLGSIAWDGYPDGQKQGLLNAKTEEEFLRWLPVQKEDWTSPEMGWPWPWKTSATTDYAYCFNPRKGKVYIYCFDKKRKWPNMKTDKAAPSGDKRSGLMVFYSPK